MPASGRVLIVDDEVNARAALAELLRDEGYVVETVADGESALAVLDSFRPQVLLTDINMPHVDGLQLLRSVRERNTGITVVVMTAGDGVDTLRSASRQGADYFLTKPIDLAELGRIIGLVTARATSS